MAEQYTVHVSPPVSRDHFTTLPLVEFLVKKYGRVNNIKELILLKLEITNIKLELE